MTQPVPNQPLRRYLAVQTKTDKATRDVLERAARDIQDRILVLMNKPGIGAQVRTDQLRLVLNEIRDIQHDLWRKGITPIAAVGRKEAAEAAETAAEELQRVLYTALPEQVAQAISDGIRATARAGIEADHARVPRALSARVYDNFALTSGQVEQAIRAGIVQGLSARELARSVYQYISPTTPGGASYAAMRLARTELNNAFHEQQKKTGLRPGVNAVVWNLSGSHPKPDECNQFAGQDRDGLGAGKYKPDNVPDKPHPQCLCYLTYDTMTPEQWAEAFKQGKFDDELDRRTKANLQRLGVKQEDVVVKPVKPPAKKATPRTPSTNPKAVRARERRAAKKAAPTTPADITKPRLPTKTVPAKETTRLYPPKAPIPHSDVIQAYLKLGTDREKLIETLQRAHFYKTEREAARAVDSMRDRLQLGRTPTHPGLDAKPKIVRGNNDRRVTIGEDARAVNPKYRQGRQYQVNCTHCVNTFELRARGYDVRASKLPDALGQNGRSSQEVLDRWRLPNGDFHNRTIGGDLTFKEIAFRASQWPDGARGWIRVSWDQRYGGGGHIFNVEKLNGQVRYIEAQTGQLFAPIDFYQDQARPGSWGIVRVDDLVPTDRVLDFVE